jgi:hypothetical protein
MEKCLLTLMPSSRKISKSLGKACKSKAVEQIPCPTNEYVMAPEEQSWVSMMSFSVDLEMKGFKNVALCWWRETSSTLRN